MKGWFEQRKALIIVMGVAFILLALFFVPIYTRDSIEYILANEGSELPSTEKIEDLDISKDNRGIVDKAKSMFSGVAVEDFGGNYSCIFNNMNAYLSNLKTISMVYWIVMIVILLVMKTDREYAGAEHGSADWARNGEEFSVLSRKEGFILAKDHYLPMIPNPPTGKNGNILVIGGSRKW